jgi:hypothetical protein
MNQEMPSTLPGPQSLRNKAEHERRIAKSTRLIEEFQAEYARTRAACLALYEGLVGPDAFAPLQRDRAVAVRGLEDANPRIRRTSLYLLVEHWDQGAEVVGRCEQMACDDPDVEVREDAIRGLGHYYADSQDRRIGKLLATLTRSEQEPAAVRLEAFRSLIVLSGRATCWPKLLLALEFPQDVAWELVDQFLFE